MHYYYNYNNDRIIKLHNTLTIIYYLFNFIFNHYFINNIYLHTYIYVKKYSNLSKNKINEIPSSIEKLENLKEL